jgi:hypothetical protein
MRVARSGNGRAGESLGPGSEPGFPTMVSGQIWGEIALT